MDNLTPDQQRIAYLTEELAKAQLDIGLHKQALCFVKDSNKGLTAQVGNLSGSLTAARRNNDILRADRQLLQEALDGAEAMGRDRANLLEELAKLEAGYKDLQFKNQKLRTELDGVKEHRAELVEHTLQLMKVLEATKRQLGSLERRHLTQAYQGTFGWVPSLGGPIHGGCFVCGKIRPCPSMVPPRTRLSSEAPPCHCCGGQHPGLPCPQWVPRDYTPKRPGFVRPGDAPKDETKFEGPERRAPSPYPGAKGPELGGWRAECQCRDCQREEQDQ